MGYIEKNTLTPKDSVVEETQDLFKTYRDKRSDWASAAQEDREFRLGNQWTQEQKDVLEARGQAPIVVNRIHPAVESAKALITTNRPSFRCAPREDSDNKVANVMSGMLSYMYDISDGQQQVRQIVDDYYVCGAGYALVYQDPSKDNGKGEVCFTALDPLDVYVDPNSSHRFLDDAENIIYSKVFTKEQAKKIYPLYKSAIDNAEGENAFGEMGLTGQYANTNRVGEFDQASVFFPGDKDTQGDSKTEYVRGYERYYKKYVKRAIVHQSWDNKELVMEEEELQEYMTRVGGIYEGKVIENESQIGVIEEELSRRKEGLINSASSKINKDIERMTQESLVAYKEKEKELQEGIQLNEIVPERAALELQKFQEQSAEQIKQFEEQAYKEAGMAFSQPGVEKVTYAQLVEAGFIKVATREVERVHLCVVLGDVKLYSRVLPTDKYPIVPFMNLHTRTPYPMSDVRLVKGLQQYINKIRSLVIAHATTSTNLKVLVPTGSVDMKDFEEKWAQPGVGIEVDFDMGQPVVAQPAPLPNELYQNEAAAKNDIDHALGLYELMMGNSQSAPQTYKATISIDEFGQRKIKSKLADIEGGLVRVGKVAIDLMQELYTNEKVFRVTNPNNSITEYAINKKLYDDKKNEVKVFNDIAVGSYDVAVVSGSTLPSNRYAELEFYMEALEKGLVDRQEVLKKTEIFDMEGVLQRTDIIQKLEQQLEQAQEQLKSLSGDMQTLTRENVHLKQKVEVEKFKSNLDGVENKVKAAGTVFEKRLDDTLTEAKTIVREAKKPPKKDTSSSKSS
tara:strand:- start:4943 stop:7321 length:2379 start_codon:yes stop_codon:yes gene_type:complete